MFTSGPGPRGEQELAEMFALTRALLVAILEQQGPTIIERATWRRAMGDELDHMLVATDFLPGDRMRVRLITRPDA